MVKIGYGHQTYIKKLDCMIGGHMSTKMIWSRNKHGLVAIWQRAVQSPSKSWDEYDAVLNFSCTIMWLAKYYLMYQGNHVHKLYKILNLTRLEMFKRCDFDAKLAKCDKNSFTRSVESSSFRDFVFLSPFLISILSFIVSLLGLIPNILTIIVVSHKDNKKTFEGKRQYDYMRLNYCVILIIQVFSLVNECELPFGLFCSGIRQLVPIQFYKIIFDQFFSSMFKTISNFTYMAFSFNRLSLVGKDHDKVPNFRNFF